MIEFIDYNIELENVVLGAIMIENSAFARCKDLLVDDAFYDNTNKEIYKLINKMYHNSIPIDILTAYQYAYKTKLNNSIPNIAYQISTKPNYVGSTANLEYHCLVLRELYINRLVKEIKNSINIDNDVLVEVELLQDKLKKAKQINTTTDWEELKEIIINIRQNLENEVEDGIHIGMHEFDKISGGLKKGEVMILGARPSVGKTAFACQFAVNIAKQGLSVGIISLEMPNSRLATRIISQITNLPYWKIDRHLLNANEYELLDSNLENIIKYDIYFSEKTGVNVHDIRAKAEKLKSKKLDILFIDYLGLIEPEKANNREQEISKISRGLKLLAMQLDIPIILLAQLNRESETSKSKPKLSNLRDSGSIEQDADIVCFIHSEYKAGVLLDDNGLSTENKREFIVAKYRNGYTKNIQLNWNGETMTFSENDGAYIDEYKHTTTNFNNKHLF